MRQPEPIALDIDGELDGVYRRYRDGIRHYIARAFGAGPPDPDDVVHAAFEKFASLEQRNLVANPQAFLMASARNYVLDQRRRFKVRTAHAEDERATGTDRDDFDAERVLVSKERWKVLEDVIRAMEPRRQEILIMNRIHGLSCAEIARRKRCSATLVKTELARALLACERAVREADGE